jgi:hypothetical protein
LVFGILCLIPQSANAHGIGSLYALPVPLPYYLGASAAAVALSFFLFAFFTGASDLKRANVRRIQLRWLPASVSICAFISSAVFLIALAAGLFGNAQTYRNFLPTYFWVFFLIGFAVLSAIIGNSFERIGPINTIARALRLGKNPQAPFKAPKILAPLLLYGLFWVELISGYSQYPPFMGFVVTAYTALTLAFTFGIPGWLERSEVFNVMYGLFGRLSWITLDDGNKSLEIASPTGRLRNLMSDNTTLVFVAMLLAGATFDALHSTIAWAEFLLRFGLLSSPVMVKIADLVGMLILPLILLLLFLFSTLIMSIITRRQHDGVELARYFVWSLVPIAFGYIMAHNFGLLVATLPSFAALLSDPFGIGWNLFGTAHMAGNQLILGAKLVWFIEIGFVVAAHVGGVWFAHAIALQQFKDRKTANLSQIPLVILMLGFTVGTLWLLAQQLTISP